jgi:hypothetical protein
MSARRDDEFGGLIPALEQKFRLLQFAVPGKISRLQEQNRPVVPLCWHLRTTG